MLLALVHSALTDHLCGINWYCWVVTHKPCCLHASWLAILVAPQSSVMGVMGALILVAEHVNRVLVACMCPNHPEITMVVWKLDYLLLHVPPSPRC
jgi:hypothetical protein